MPLSPSGKYYPNVETKTAMVPEDAQNYGGILSGYNAANSSRMNSKGQYTGDFPQQSGLFDSNQNTSARAIIPEDSARNLFQTLYEALVFATHEDRQKAVQMLATAYDLGIDLGL